ncbi:MAG: S8 family serine peptidase [Chloroflexota bacterium]
MRKKGLFLLIVSLIALFIAATFREEARAVALDGPLPTDQIIIRFSESADVTALLVPDVNGRLATLSETAGVTLAYVRPMFETVHVVKLPERLDYAEVEDISANLSSLEDVVYAEPDRILQIVDDPQPSSPVTPWDLDGSVNIYLPFIARPSVNDPLLVQQWHYDYVPGSSEGINLLNAWDINQGSSNVVVAVVDTGILNHADLAGRTVPGYDFIHDSFVGNDGNGRDANPADPGDWTAANECGSGYPAQDSSWHGTHVAGTIGAANNNALGVSGIDWNARILPVRALGKCGGYTSDILDGVRWAAGLSVSGVPNNANPADVINLSLGGAGSCDSTEQAVYTAVYNAGVTVVVAAGNSNANAAGYSPASCNNVITVAATDRTGGRASYSNYGSVVEVSAPGGETWPTESNGVLSTLNTGTKGPVADAYVYYQGTSMASPHVAGVAALILAEYPAYTPAQVLSRLQSTARPFPGGSDCNTSICGTGIIDAFKALGGTIVTPPPVDNPFTNAGFESGTIGWTESSSNGWDLITSILPVGLTAHGGSWLAWLGGDDNETSTIQQQVPVPASGSYLAYYHWIDSADSCGFDVASVRVNGATVAQYDLCSSQNTGGWVKKVVNLGSYAGQSVTLQIRVVTNGSLPSSLFVDDFSRICQPHRNASNN